MSLEANGCCFCACIPTNSTGILQRFGRFLGILVPGLHCICPCTDRVNVIPNNMSQLNNKTKTKTRDDVFVTLETRIQYQIDQENSKDAFYLLQNAHQQMEAYIDNCIRNTATNKTLDELFASKNELSLAIQNEVKDKMSRFGYTIIETLLTDIKVPEIISQAMNSKSQNLQLKVAAQHKADADYAIVTRAAEAQAEVMRLQGVGIANQRLAVVTGLEKAIKIIGHEGQIQVPDAMEYTLKVQHLDMIRDIGTHSRAVMMVPYPSPNTSTGSVGGNAIGPLNAGGVSLLEANTFAHLHNSTATDSPFGSVKGGHVQTSTDGSLLSTAPPSTVDCKYNK